MDLYTKKSLELTENARDHEKYGSLFWLLDMTKSAMGARLLKDVYKRQIIYLCVNTSYKNIHRKNGG